ncbi:hypothetical protein DXG01_001303 [Tephrocybe rancida]|nr:hypothetical protein DXG01_001303 [Tephrocybe rancida]
MVNITKESIRQAVQDGFRTYQPGDTACTLHDTIHLQSANDTHLPHSTPHFALLDACVWRGWQIQRPENMAFLEQQVKDSPIASPHLPTPFALK